MNKYIEKGQLAKGISRHQQLPLFQLSPIVGEYTLYLQVW